MSKSTNKKIWPPSALLNPVPVVLVSCGDKPDNFNIITIAWCGTICSEPAMTYVSIRPERLSHEIISRTGEFVINLPTKGLARKVDYCGVKSGRKVNKFKELGLTYHKAEKVKAPLIKECPVNLECRVSEIKKLGSHDLFLAEILNVHVDCGLVNSKNNLNLGKAKLICYSHGEYYALGERLGSFGFSLKK